jgi:hypothetical protein
VLQTQARAEWPWLHINERVRLNDIDDQVAQLRKQILVLQEERARVLTAARLRRHREIKDWG